jgi:dipeptidyl aminopeptidase/acylaminoacyl peptidase
MTIGGKYMSFYVEGKMRRYLLVALLILSFVSIAAQEESSPAEAHAVTIDDLLTFRTVGDVQISPDGRWILYVVTTPDLKKNERNSDIFRVPFEGGPPVKMTASPKSDVSPRWSPDGLTIAFLSDREGKMQVFTLHAFGGEAEKLTDHDESVSSFEWRPNGKAILFLALEPLSEQQKEEQKNKEDQIVVDDNLRPQHLWLFDIDTKKSEQITKGNCSVLGFEWSPDGAEILFSAAEKATAFDRMAHTDIFTVRPGGEPVRAYENDGPDNSPSFSPDGQKIAFLSRLGALNPVGSQSLMLLDRESGGVTNLTQGFKDYISGHFWAADGAGLFFQGTEGTTAQLYYMDTSGGGLTRLTGDAGVCSSFDLSADGGRIAFIREDGSNPPDVHSAEISGTNPFQGNKLTEINPQAKEWKLGRTEVIQWNSPDGQVVEGLLIYPVDYQKGRRCPLIVLIHGGPSGVFVQNFKASWYNSGHYFAGRGWAMLMPNVRGSIGYGDEFQQANINDWGGGDYVDIMSGVDHLIARGIADPEKLAVRGWSYGGYMTAWIVSRTARFKAAAVGAGLTNLVSMYGTNDIPQVLEQYFGGDIYGESLYLYRERSALSHIGNAVTPTLILHGQGDQRVPIGQAQEFYYALKKKGVPTQLVFYPREGHGPGEINHQRDILQRWTVWFSRYVLGEEVTFEEKQEEAEKPDKKTAEEEPK